MPEINVSKPTISTYEALKRAHEVGKRLLAREGQRGYRTPTEDALQRRITALMLRLALRSEGSK